MIFAWFVEITGLMEYEKKSWLRRPWITKNLDVTLYYVECKNHRIFNKSTYSLQWLGKSLWIAIFPFLACFELLQCCAILLEASSWSFLNRKYSYHISRFSSSRFLFSRTGVIIVYFVSSLDAYKLLASKIRYSRQFLIK